MLPDSIAAPARSLVGALFDAGHGVPDERVVWTLQEVDELSIACGIKTRGLFFLTLLLVEYLPILFGGSGRMSELEDDARIQYLERLDASSLAGLIALPKALLCLVYYEHPDALRETGYDSQPLITADRRAA